MLFALFILPLIRNVFFWAYVWQLKEYRYDRFNDFISTKEGKKAKSNILYLIEITNILLFGIIYIFYRELFLLVSFKTIYSATIGVLSIESLFVLFKILRGEFIIPKFTSRMILNLFLTFILQGVLILYFYNSVFIYLVIFCILATSQNFFAISIFLSSPINNYFRNKIIKNANLKIKSLNQLVSIGITGSFGKSSMKESLLSILSQEFNVISTKDNNNTPLGISNTVINKLNENYKYFICEMGAYEIGEIKELGDIVNHKFGFITGINNQHISLFGSQDNIIKTKFEIIEKVIKNDGILYVNGDNNFIINFLKNINKSEVELDIKRLPHDFDYKKIKKGEIITYGIENTNCDAFSSITEYNSGNIQFDFFYKGNKLKFKTSLFGRHQITNLTGAIAFAIDVGVTPDKIQEGINKIRSPKHTGNVIKIEKDIILIDDTYNLNYNGLLSSCESLDIFYSYKKYLVLDDILELGKSSFDVHFKLGNLLGGLGFDKIFLVGKNYSNYIEKGLIKSGFDKKNILNKNNGINSFIKELKSIASGSVILLEGRGSQKFLDIFI